MAIVLVIAPHPDDETLGCGATLLRHIAAGDVVHWMICTSIDDKIRFGSDKVEGRKKLISSVFQSYPFSGMSQLELKSAQLDEYPLSNIISQMNAVIRQLQPNIIYMPFGGDVHSDHRIVFDCMLACTKSFRHPYLREIHSYEVLSETNFNIDSSSSCFKPNYYVDITGHLERKLEIVRLYDEEMGEFPFPRNTRLMRALSDLRAAEAGVMAAEAFVTLKRILK